MESQIEVYPKQAAFLQSTAKTNFFMGGRGAAKSSSIGLKNLQRMGEMPRAKGFLAAVTYNIVLTKTLPPILKIWDLIGYTEGIHYVIGKRPPKHFDRPHSAPKKYENVITWWCGYTIELISLDRFQNARGGSYDFGDIDEIGGLIEDAYTDVLVPSMRDNEHVINSPYHHQICAYTSVPWTTKGWWIFKKEEQAKLDKLKRFFDWHEATAHDNNFISQATIDRWEREMPHLKFQIEVLNMRIRKSELPFYNKFDDTIHTFTPKYQYGFDENLIYGAKVIGNEEYNVDAPLDISFDFGGHINTCLVAQRKGNIERVLSQHYKLNENSLRDLLKEFLSKYKNHKAKTINIYGEPRGHDPRPEGKTLYAFIVDELKENGWTCSVKVKPGHRTEDHVMRREFINVLLEEVDSKLPKVRINLDDCKDIIVSIQTAATKVDGRKDKSSEGNPNYPQQEATHFSDAFDYWLIQKYYKKKKRVNRRPGTAHT